MNKTLVIHVGNENKPHIEKLSTKVIDKSLFKEQYKYALKMLDQYVFIKTKNKVHTQKQSQTDTDNNIFAFDGDRGVGKTSCMMSVAQFLVKSKDHEGKIELKDKYVHLTNQEFYSLDLIDPSYFDKYHNILSFFVAKLYKKYDSCRRSQRRSNSTLEADYEAKERMLVEKFSLTQRNLNCLMEDKAGFDDSDDFSKLEKLSASIELKENIKDLVDSFLKFVGEPNAMLLVTIDDLDLNAQQGDRMAEEIRKYLVQDNILVLIAVKIDQLSLIKRKEFQNDFKNVHKDIDKELDNMVERYMVKFIPQSHRIYMPDFRYYMDSDIMIDTGKEVLTFYNEPVKQAILSLIFWKTRYLFYNTPQKVSPIVPRNLRELNQMLGMLAPLENFRNGMEAENNYNKTLFKKYFFQDWAENNLGREDSRLINIALSEEEPSLVNKTILNILKKRFHLTVSSRSRIDTIGVNRTELDYVIDDNNIAYNISAGDILSIIFLLERQYTGDEDMNFLFMLKSLYSMRLYEYYDERTEDNMRFEMNKDNVALRNDVLSDLDSYDRLVGGRYFNPRIIRLTPHSSAEALSRIDRKIDGGILNDLIKETSEQLENYSNIDEQQKKILEYKVKLSEFFMLCSARRFDTKNDKKQLDFYNPEYRQSSQINYLEPLNVKNIYFDLNSFLYNVIDCERCYGRFAFGDEFCKLLKLTGVPSLCNEIYNEAMQSRIEGSEQTFESIVSLRNVEIIQDLYSHIESYYRKYPGDDKSIVKLFFSHLASFQIFTHDRSEEEKPFAIKMRFAKPIADFLVTVPDKDEEDLFYRIYSPKELEEEHIPVRRKRNKRPLAPVVAVPMNLDKIMAVFKDNGKYRHVYIKRVCASEQPAHFDRKNGSLREKLEQRLQNMPEELTYEEIKQLLQSI